MSFKKAVRALKAFDGVVEAATEAELADASARADRGGLFTCPHTGVALAALEKLAARGEVTKAQRAVVISTASGLKFADFKVRYHEGALPGATLRNVPVELPERYGAQSGTRSLREDSRSRGRRVKVVQPFRRQVPEIVKAKNQRELTTFTPSPGSGTF